MNILIKNAKVLTNNENFDILENALVYIKENRIFYVGNEPQKLKVNKIIDAKNNLVMPGLINCHTHIGMGIFRNYGNDVSLEEWLYKYIFPIEDQLEADDVYYSSLLSMAEMISTGTTSFIDMYFFIDEIAKAAEKIGMRGIISLGLTHDNIDNKLKIVEDFYYKWHNKANGRIQTMVAPHAVYTNDKEDLKKAISLAKKLSLGINIHLNESKTEVENSIKEHGKSPLEYVHDLKMTDQHLIAAHCVWLSDKEKVIAKEKDVILVHNPVSNLKLASGIMNVQDNLNWKLNVSLGTDGVASNNNLDMFEEMKFASLLAKGISSNPRNLDAKSTIKMATLAGARALQKEHELGKIEQGYLADLIIIDLNNITHSPNVDILASLVYSTSGNDVITTIIDGNIVYENRQFKNIEIDFIIKKCNEIFKKLKSKIDSKASDD
ncbi:5-methylthioadenosine/S-adenosylhomocysteine deaminase [Metamycoplasma arthritidis]|uniref:5-methylthioadenosine/S-adenosylhomocysteine deaminase n=1 Tax=Metamycoplasma arthritidis (strain 158L3-1) TaxID=243272 RepID=B3PMX8_META1|nr:amidohydrolase [Metamycoplasma arthritidis]ACF07380.1 cytosine deaminase [Metamycoplasma arthritidis 158L3-1]VEU78900.1 5-methylthioadenosine/S-adenosylhomocysteine deaminase [Metamycoplasma arthritidis]